MTAVIDWLLGGPLGPEGTLAWTGSSTLVTVAAVAAVTAWIVAVAQARGVSSRLAEGALWAVALVGAVVAVAGPVWVEEEGRVEPARVALLIDGSASMGVLEDGQPRAAAVDAVIAAVEASGREVEVFHFGDELRTGAPTAYDLAGTDLGAAFDALGERLAGERLAGVAVVTDGLDRGLLRRSFLRDEWPTAPSLPGPLTLYPVGQLGDLRDLSVRSVDAGGYAFIRAPFRITASLQAVGVSGPVPVTLSRDGATITQQTVTLDDAGSAQVTFEVVAEDAGRFAYAVSVPVYEGDAVPANNTMPVVVKVVRDRIRVLQVAGAPSWDVKFMRRFLKGDPSVQLVSFFILRTPSDVSSAYSERELSLIQFPYERLFDEDLSTFDVVFLQNFDYRPYFTMQGTELLQNLADYVRDGGSLVMVGGDRSFELGDYGTTPLQEVLPVRLATDRREPDLRPFQAALTPEGARHPVTRLVADATENGRWWSRLVDLDGTNRPMGLMPGATTLLAHPTLRAGDGGALPVLSVREVGEGRTMALTVDSSWKWSLAEAAEGRGNQTYLRFWKNAIRWLMRDSTADRVTVDTPRENYAVGEDVRVVLRARDEGFAALAGASVALEIDNEGQLRAVEGVTDADGELVSPVEALRPGTHRVRATVRVEGREIGVAETVFAVTSRDPELDEVAPDPRFLAWLGGATGGRLHLPGDPGPMLIDPDADRVVRERKETPLWRAPLLSLLVGLSAGLAWVIRRRAGLR